MSNQNQPCPMCGTLRWAKVPEDSITVVHNICHSSANKVSKNLDVWLQQFGNGYLQDSSEYNEQFNESSRQFMISSIEADKQAAVIEALIAEHQSLAAVTAQALKAKPEIAPAAFMTAVNEWQKQRLAYLDEPTGGDDATPNA